MVVVNKHFLLSMTLYILALNIYYNCVCTGQKYPDPFLGLRPKHNSITIRTRPHASPGPIWTSDLN